VRAKKAFALFMTPFRLIENYYPFFSW